MRTKKLLSLILILCLAFTTIGSTIVVNAADDITVINVGQGVTYLLPDGETYADTSKIGYRIIEGTDGVTYRVNVGEYKVVMRDDFEAYTENQYTAAISGREITGGKFTKAAYADATDSAQKLTKDGTNTVAAFGPHTSSNSNFLWNPTDKAKGEAFKISYKLRVASFDLDTAIVGTSSNVNYFFANNLGNTGAVQLRAYVTENNGVRSIGNTQLRCQGSPAVNADISDFIEWTEPDENNIISMKNYITVEIEGNNVQYSTKVNGNEIGANSVLYSSDAVSKNGVASIVWAKRNSDGVDTVIYADDMVYSKAVYVTDTLEKVPVTADVALGASEAQTATAMLNMSDGTTKEFTVNYTADTTSAGVWKANGTIDGFDGTIPVTYTVSGVVLNDNFQDAELGTLTPDNPMNGWTVSNSKGTVEDTVITFEREDYPNHHVTSNNVLKINRTADDTEESKDYVLRRELSEPVTAADADVMSVKFNMLRNNNNTIKFTVGLESEYNGGVAVSPFEFILVASQIYLPGSSTPMYFDGKYDEYSPQVGIWHEFEILADIKNDYVYFYEQDKLLGSGRIEDAAQKIYGLSAITLESDSTGNGSFNNGGGFIWIDNINVELFSEQDALKEAGSRLSRLFRGRISEDIALPTNGWYSTDIKWESDNTNVIDNTGKITRPESGSVVAANMTATVSKSGLSTEKFYYTALINPGSVVLDESFEFPRSVNGQPMSSRPYTGGMVPWHGWRPEVYSENVNWDTSGTLVEENESNKAFRLERLSGVSTDSQLYIWEKLLTEPVSDTERASVSFRIMREANSPNMRIGFGEDWITEVRLGTGKLYHSTTWSGQPNFEKGHNYANIGEWYNLDFLIDFPNGKCYAYCDNQFVAEGDIPEGVTFDLIMMTHYRGSAGTSSSKLLIDDIVVNKLSETEFNAKLKAYADAASYDTLIKDVSLSRGKVGSIAIRNYNELSDASGIIVAEYDSENGKLQKVKMYDIPEKSNVKAMQTVVIDQTASSGNKATVFVWGNSIVKPLALPSETIIP